MSFTQSGFAFVSTHVVINGALPVSIGDNAQFRSATDVEVELIRRRLAQISGRRFHEAPVYEDQWIEAEKRDGSKSYRLEPLPREAWKYWVLAFEGSNGGVHTIESLMQLLPVSLEFAFTLMFEGARQSGEERGFLMGGVNPYQVHRFEQCWHPRTLRESDLARLTQYMVQLDDIPERFDFVRRAVRGLDELRGVPERSELTIVGLFALIESLITHEPRKQETLDSIIHQVKNKMALLRKRYETAVPLADYFGDASEDTIWSKLYDYRSTVAHGSAFDFQQKGAVLRGREQVIPFLRENVKQLLIMALRDPEFFDDLRRC